MKYWLIIYDIRNARRLGRVMRIVTEYAVRVQKSVFELEATVSDIERIQSRIFSVIDESEDFVVYFELCSEDWQKREKYGILSELKSGESFNIY